MSFLATTSNRRPAPTRLGKPGWICTCLLVVVGFLAASCTSDDADGGDPVGTVIEDPRRIPDEISGPIEGEGIVVPQPAAPLPSGYVEEEFFISGEATSYTALESPDDGFWTAEPDAAAAPYATRVIVRRPAAAEAFSGTVIVEWLNVSAIEASPDWGYAAEEIGREGHAYVAVSAQAQGVMGGDAILVVTVDEGAAADAGATGEVGGNGLVNTDPDRYGTLTHPGDAYAYDVFSQVGRALGDDRSALLGGAHPEQLIAAGESQSAAFMTTYVNAVHPLAGVYDGFMIHSRGAGAAPLDGEFISSREQEQAEPVETGVLVRTDLEEPVFVFESETDLTLLDFAKARQPDTDMIRTWEVAGTSHTDAHLFRVFIGGPRDAGLGSIIGCVEPINTGPHHEVYQAALNHMVRWAAGGAVPPEGEPLEVDPDDSTALVRDDNMIAVGGIRNPLTDVPVVATTGDPPEPATPEDFDVCGLFGSTQAFDTSTLMKLYPSPAEYLEDFAAATDEAVDAGFLLPADAEALMAESELNTALFE